MARTRRRSSYRKSRRWNPKAAPGYVPLNAKKFRRKTIWNMARRGKRTFKNLNPLHKAYTARSRRLERAAKRGGRKGMLKHYNHNPRGRKSRRRNPSGTELRDGTSIQVSGSDVTLFSPFGETYEYSDLSIGALKKLRRATSFSQASRIASSGGVTRSINPRGGRRTRRKGARYDLHYKHGHTLGSPVRWKDARSSVRKINRIMRGNKNSIRVKYSRVNPKRRSRSRR